MTLNRLILIVLMITMASGCCSKEAYFNKKAISLATKYQASFTYNPKAAETNVLKAWPWKKIHAALDEFEKVFALMPDSIAFAVDTGMQFHTGSIGPDKVWAGQEVMVRVADSFYLNKNKQQYLLEKGLVTPHVIFVDNKKSR